MSLMGEGALQRAETAFTMPKKTARQETQTGTLNDCVRKAVRQYLADLGDVPPEDLYRLVLSQVEKPLIEEVLTWAGGNQCRTAKALGISRGTLRKRIDQHKID